MTNDAAFHSVYEAYSQLVYNLALRYVPNTADAQDITQEVFVKVYQHLPHYDAGKASLKTWITRITIHHCLDFLRKQKTARRWAPLLSILGGAAEAIPAPSFDHPGAAAEGKEALEMLFRHIAALPDKQKTALILVRIEGCSQREAAAIMNTGVKAVESLLQRAKGTLEKKWKRSEGF